MNNQWNLRNLATILRETDPTVSATAPSLRFVRAIRQFSGTVGLHAPGYTVLPTATRAVTSVKKKEWLGFHFLLDFRYVPICSDMFRNFARFCAISRDFARFCAILRDFPTFSDIFRHFPISFASERTAYCVRAKSSTRHIFRRNVRQKMILRAASKKWIEVYNDALWILQTGRFIALDRGFRFTSKVFRAAASLGSTRNKYSAE